MGLIDDLLFQASYLFRTFVVALLFILSYGFVHDNRNSIKIKLKELLVNKWRIVFLVYAAFIFTSTLIARPRTLPYKKIFQSFGLYNNGQLNMELIENILLYIPYTFLFHKGFDIQKPCIWSLFLSFGTSVFIEICQLIFWLGFCQISDIIHNTIGGMIGLALYIIINKLIKRKK